jgi:hypothetical protein
MNIRNLLASAAATATLAIGLSFGGAGTASASVTTVCAENADGCTGSLNLTSTINVASDGESPFFPFGLTYDVSDAIEFDTALGAVQVGKGGWTHVGLDGNNLDLWALPATTPCGSENEPECEPHGNWVFPGFVAVGTYNFNILESDRGGVSDLIKVYNNVDGVAALSFISDPIPEPATWALMIGGLGLLGAGLRMRRHGALAAA